MSNGKISVYLENGLGNQTIQYCVARSYAEKIGAEFYCDDWLGRRTFGWGQHPSINLPQYDFDKIPNGETNLMLRGNFQHKAATSLLSRDKMREWLPIPPPITEDKYIAVHRRLGDYNTLNTPFAIISASSYGRILTAIHSKLPVHWFDQQNNNFKFDFLELCHATILIRGASTFSWLAGVLSNGRVFAPIVRGKRRHCDCVFVEGNWPVCRCPSTCPPGALDDFPF